jgi:poly(glycerol-phosphate) alpha-glucosyltransferase
MYFFLSAGLGYKLTGIEHAILKRSEIFNKLGVENKILTINFNKDYSLINELHNVDSSNFINIYDELQGVVYINKKENKVDGFLKKNYLEFDLREVGNARDYRVYKKNRYFCYISTYECGQISYINYFNVKKDKIKREVYNKNGYLTNVVYLYNNLKKMVHYFNSNGSVVIKEYYGDEADLQYIEVVDGDQLKNFGSMDEWVEDWLNNVFKRYINTVVYSDKNKLYNHILIKIRKNNYKFISVFHSMHVRNPKDIEGGVVNSNYKVSLENIDKFDGFIVSTEDQKIDIIKRYGCNLNIFVIPPSFVNENTNSESNYVDGEFKVISVGRYYVEKRLDHIILAIKLLVGKYPDISLYLYGFGDQRDNFKYEKKIRDLVVNEKLERNIKFEGYKHDILNYIGNSTVSVVTSTIEGFCIGILDSLSVGTPVVSYNIKYGPNEIIVNNESGFLVQEENIKELAEKIEEVYFKKEMRISAKERSENFSMLMVMDKWLNHIKEINNV